MGGPCTVDGKSVGASTDNFALSEFTMDGATFYSAEHAYQFLKMKKQTDKARLVGIVPKPKESAWDHGMRCWNAGQRGATQPNWENVKVERMYKANKSKVSQSPALTAELISSKDSGDGCLRHMGSGPFWDKMNPVLLTLIREELLVATGLGDAAVVAKLRVEVGCSDEREAGAADEREAGAAASAAKPCPGASATPHRAPGKVCILGGGIIGASTAYYLSLKGVTDVTVMDCAGVASCASGKAGGFLAERWCDGCATGGLARRSFALHAQLGHLFPSTGYRRVTTLSLQTQGQTREAAAAAGAGKSGVRQLPAWIDRPRDQKVKILGDESNTAQVHPFLLTNKLMEEACRRGAKVVGSEVVGLSCDGRSRIRVSCKNGQPDGPTVVEEFDTVVIAMGPWSGQALGWLGDAGNEVAASVAGAVSGSRAHSAVLSDGSGLEPGGDTAGSAVGAQCLFLEHTEKGKEMLDPEIYPRPDGTVYVCCGFGDKEPLPASPLDVVPVAKYGPALAALAESVSSRLAVTSQNPVVASQACFLPDTTDGVPLIGALGSGSGAFVACGHSCWGILLGPATGEALAELIVKGSSASSSTADLSPFDPSRSMN